MHVSESSHVFYRKSWVLWNNICRCPCESPISWRKLKTVWVSDSAPTCSHWERPWKWWPTGPLVEYHWPRSKSTKRGLENNKACYGQEKTLCVSIATCLCVSPSVSLTHNGSFDFKKNKENYIFIKKCCDSFLCPYIFYHYEYTTV